ncbi:MAG: aspartate/glutamate racemase family protein [Alphaproteobacteria bacterium]|nr:aspartate/glutamate racemase family protein [Alphaproteobacteria bacterium]
MSSIPWNLRGDVMIGVFDSGHGGLTVLRTLADRLPGRGFVYLGDHANAPYGERDAEDVYNLAIENIERLFRIDCRLVILACNTAAAVALRRLQRTWLDDAWAGRRVLGVLVPVVEAIVRQPWHVEEPRTGPDAPSETVAIFATRRTVECRAYVGEILKRAPDVLIVQQACPGMVDAIEAGAPQDEIHGLVEGFVAELLERMQGVLPDVAVLGCTHYGLAARAFRKALPPGTAILHQPDLVAESLADYLVRHPEFAAEPQEAGVAQFLTTGDPVTVSRLASRFYGADVTFRGFS